MKKILFNTLLSILVMNSLLFGIDLRREINLNGPWRFEIGDDLNWAKFNYDDSDWEIIDAPDYWEDQGFPGYDGYAWYRKSFTVSERLIDESLFLRLGQIDDVDQVYLNGQFIGATGKFPPAYETAYNIDRQYYIPKIYLRFEQKNIIAVRVYDAELGGGMLRGNLGIYVARDDIKPNLDLSGFWKFSPGDNLAWSSDDLDDSNWDEISVPGLWESQGYADLDGFAWYRKEFTIPRELRRERLVLMLGKIDDVDEVYINGTKIGSTGPIPKNDYRGSYNGWWNMKRAYFIPSNILKKDRSNVIAVRVYDAWRGGGIYDFPIGLMTRERYQEYVGRKDNIWDILEKFF